MRLDYNYNYSLYKSSLFGRVVFQSSNAPSSSPSSSPSPMIITPQNKLNRYDANEDNPEILKIRTILDQRQEAMKIGKVSRQQLDRSIGYQGRMKIVDLLTSPVGGKIDDYDDGYFGDETDENNPTRSRLNGYLYAHDIFSGGGQAGVTAINEGLEKPYELYHKYIGDSRLTMKDLEEGMSLKNYFAGASQYTKFDKVIGIIAGLESLSDSKINDNSRKRDYKEYLKSQFEELNTADKQNNEDSQIQFLFGIKSLADFLNSDDEWRSEYDRIDNLTDPNAIGAQITDYPGTFSKDKDNKTRWQLNGYLYSVYLFNGKSSVASNQEFQRAAKMFDDSGWIDEDFTQEMIEGDPEGSTDRFGLKKYLIEAEQYTANDEIKGIIAGLLKQADSLGANQQSYKEYLKVFLRHLSPNNSREEQLIILSGIKSPESAETYIKHDLLFTINRAVLSASIQHSQFILDDQSYTDLAKDTKDITLAQIMDLSNKVKNQINDFIDKRSMTAIKSLQDTYNAMIAENKKDKNPLYDQQTLDELAKRIQSNAREFIKARGSLKETALDGVINQKYLMTLKSAESNYFTLIDEIEAKNQSITDYRNNKLPNQTTTPQSTQPQKPKPIGATPLPPKPKPAPVPPVLPSKPKTPEQKEKTEAPLMLATAWDAIFSKVINEINKSPQGVDFSFVYNGLQIPAKIRKVGNQFNFSFNSFEAGQGNLTFTSIDQIKSYCDNGNLNQYLATATIIQRKNWDRFKGSNWLDELKEAPKRTGKWSVSIELDWKRNHAFETGNGKIDLSVGPDGTISYKIYKTHAASNGTDIKHGNAGDFTQLIQAISHTKYWSENYNNFENQHNFKDIKRKEILLANLMTLTFYKKQSSKIGEVYNFNNFYNMKYGYMYLNWGNEADNFKRNRSIQNPVLEVKANENGTVTWKLQRLGEDKITWMGTYGIANSLNDLFNQISEVRKDSKARMNTKSSNLPNLGNFGYSPS